MIKKLQRRLILLTMTSVFLLLFSLVTAMNIANYSSLVREGDRLLDQIAAKPAFPGEKPSDKPEPPPEGVPKPTADLSEKAVPSNQPSVPTHTEARYFSVTLAENGEVMFADLSQIGSITNDEASSYAAKALACKKARGFLDTFRYLRLEEARAVRIVFLDMGHHLDSFDTFFKVSIGSAAGGFLLVLLIFVFVSARIIRPIAESYEKQKRFITDAGHEIKTPLTIIGANVDILEMETGENESLTDIREQTKRLTSLTNDLVYLARMEEADHTIPLVEFPISETVRETAEPFRAPAQAENKVWLCDIQPMLTVKGNDKAIRQLVSVLLDNALKYSPRGGTIRIRLFQQGHAVVLSVRNTSAIDLDENALEHIFDRFYRTDPSRNSKTGGHGIGLSIAKAIVSSHGGKISAAAENKHTFAITVMLPQNGK